MLADVTHAVARVVRSHTGRGPEDGRTMLNEDVLVTVLAGTESEIERGLRSVGRADLVSEARDTMDRALTRPVRDAVEQVIGRRVEAVTVGHHEEPDVVTVVCLLAPTGH